MAVAGMCKGRVCQQESHASMQHPVAVAVMRRHVQNHLRPPRPNRDKAHTSPMRGLIPLVAGLDLSPIAIVILLQLTKILLVAPLRDSGFYLL